MPNQAAQKHKPIYNSFLFIPIIFLTWEVLLIAAELIGLKFLEFRYSFPYVDSLLGQSGLPQWLWQWANFDGVHYLTIAKIGYDGFGTQVFFPLYPFLVGILTKIIRSEIVSGLLISHISIFLSAVLLFRFVEKQFNTTIAKWSIIFLFAFPTSFFFASFYTESLLLLLILLSFQTKNVWAGLFAALASGTKLIGIFISPVLLFFKPRNVWAVLGGAGLLSYMIHLWLKFDHRAFLFLTAQSAFQNNRASDLTGLVLPPQVIYRYLKIFITSNPQRFDFWVALLEFSAFIFGIVILAVMTHKKNLPTRVLVFSWAALLLPSLSGTFSSMPRYLLPIFPIYIFISTLKSNWLKILILISSCLLLIILTALFTRGYFIS